MEVGDCVRLKQSFIPTPCSSQIYEFGIVVATISCNSRIDVLLHLYNLDTAEVHVDEFGNRAMYSFQLDEIEPALLNDLMEGIYSSQSG